MYKNYNEYKSYNRNKVNKKPLPSQKTYNIHITNVKKPKTHRRMSNSYIDNKGDYKEKPWYANFWKVGFLNDIPTRKDYNREMDGIKYTSSIIPREFYATDEAHKRAMKAEEEDHLYGLERAQLSFQRLIYASPREWLKLIVRTLLFVFYISFLIGIYHLFKNTNIFGIFGF